MQRERRRDPYPWTWELPLLASLATLLLVVIGVQLARSLANLLAGAGWTWPDTSTGTSIGSFPSPIGTAFWTSLPAVLTGHADAGLPTPQPEGLAGPALVWASLLFTEAALLAATVWFAVHAHRRWGNGRMRGMATATEAETILGLTRLHKVAGIVRPDLYGNHVAPPAPVHRKAGQTEGVEPARARIGHGLSNPISNPRDTSGGNSLGSPWFRPDRAQRTDPAKGRR